MLVKNDQEKLDGINVNGAVKEGELLNDSMVVDKNIDLIDCIPSKEKRMMLMEAVPNKNMDSFACSDKKMELVN